MLRCVYFSFTAALALLVCLLGRASCQLDCAEPTESDFANVIPLVIPDSENPTTPEINIILFRPVCLAYSQERGRFRGVSALVEYTCTGNALCPDGTVVEQFEADCASGSWSSLVRGSNDNTRTLTPTATFSTELRENCAFCYSPELANAAGIPAGNTPDDENHCVACIGCSDSRGQDRCTGISPASCCNVYVNDMCDSDCPDDGVYTIDPTTFECLEICPDLGNVVENGIVNYSQAILEAEGGYSEGTTANVVCSTGYRGGGVIVCESGEWSPSSTLPSCEIVDCGPPPGIDNGNVTFDSTLIGSVATYECDEDYFFDDGTQTTRTCLESGEWSNEDLLCKKCDSDSDSSSDVCSGSRSRKDESKASAIAGFAVIWVLLATI